VQMRTKRKLRSFEIVKCAEWKNMLCVIFIKSVLYSFVVVWYMGDKYEESCECLSVLSERRCMFLYCIQNVIAKYVFILIWIILAK